MVCGFRFFFTDLIFFLWGCQRFCHLPCDSDIYIILSFNYIVCVYILSSAGFTYIGALNNILWTPILYLMTLGLPFMLTWEEPRSFDVLSWHLSIKLKLVPLRMNPLPNGVTTDQLFLDQRFLTGIKINCDIWYLFVWILY